MKLLICGMLLTAGLAVAPLTNAAPQDTDDNSCVMAGVGRDRVPWFLRHQMGIKRGAMENGCKGRYRTPVVATPEAQNRAIDNMITHNIKALLVVPIDPVFASPALRRAKEKGMVVVTHESPGQKNADYDIELIDNRKYAERIMVDLTNIMGTETGSYVIIVGSEGIASHNQWADEAVKWQQENFPNLKFLGKLPVGEDRNATYRNVNKLLSEHPELQGIVCFGSESGPGVGRALKENSQRRDIAVVAACTPNVCRDDIKSGYIKELLLWDPADAGVLQTYIASLVLQGRQDEIKPGMRVAGFGKPRIEGNTLIFNRPLLIMRDNVDNYNF